MIDKKWIALPCLLLASMSMLTRPIQGAGSGQHRQRVTPSGHQRAHAQEKASPAGNSPLDREAWLAGHCPGPN